MMTKTKTTTPFEAAHLERGGGLFDVDASCGGPRACLKLVTAFLVSLLLATGAAAQTISNAFDADTPMWTYPEESQGGTLGDGWTVLAGSWRVEGGKLRGNSVAPGADRRANLLVYERHGAGPDFEASVEVTATKDSNEVVFGGLVFAMKDQDTFMVIRVRVLEGRSCLQVVKVAQVDGQLQEQALVSLNLLPDAVELQPETAYKIAIRGVGEGEIEYTLTDATHGDLIAQGAIRDPEVSNGGLVGIFSTAPYVLFGNFTANNLTGKGLSIEADTAK
jgi:hypothetical protein